MSRVSAANNDTDDALSTLILQLLQWYCGSVLTQLSIDTAHDPALTPAWPTCGMAIVSTFLEA